MKTTLQAFIKNIIVIAILTIILVFIFVAQYIGAWTGPTASAPNNNVPAPINVGSFNQIKSGDITAANIKTNGQVWAGEYCDDIGANCSSSLGTTGSAGPVFFSADTVSGRDPSLVSAVGYSICSLTKVNSSKRGWGTNYGGGCIVSKSSGTDTWSLQARRGSSNVSFYCSMVCLP